MADYKEFYEARKEIIDIVKKDLIGPVYEDEILVERPSQYYVMGKLYPRAKDEQDNESDTDEDVTTNSGMDQNLQMLLIQVPWVLLLQLSQALSK